MRTLLSAVVVLSVVALVGCGQPAQGPAGDDVAREQADLQAVQELTAQWDAAENCEATLPLLTDDSVRIEPNRPAIVGKQAFLESCQESDELFNVEDSKNTNVEVRLAGDWAYVRGTWSAKVTVRSSGESFQVTGGWMGIQERQPDGSWKIARVAAPTTPESWVQGAKASSLPAIGGGD